MLHAFAISLKIITDLSFYKNVFRVRPYPGLMYRMYNCPTFECLHLSTQLQAETNPQCEKPQIVINEGYIFCQLMYFFYSDNNQYFLTIILKTEIVRQSPGWCSSHLISVRSITFSHCKSIVMDGTIVFKDHLKYILDLVDSKTQFQEKLYSFCPYMNLHKLAHR